MANCDALHLGDTIHPNEVDWVNERVAKATGLSLDFLYQTDGLEPSRRAHQMDLRDFTNLQRENDEPPAKTQYECGTCRQDVEKTVPRRRYSLSQKRSMSEAWSRELRHKMKQAEKDRTPPKICVDPYFEDWE
jgi:hypothetical protein